MDTEISFTALALSDALRTNVNHWMDIELLLKARTYIAERDLSKEEVLETFDTLIEYFHNSVTSEEEARRRQDLSLSVAHRHLSPKEYLLNLKSIRETGHLRPGTRPPIKLVS